MYTNRHLIYETAIIYITALHLIMHKTTSPCPHCSGNGRFVSRSSFNIETDCKRKFMEADCLTMWRYMKGCGVDSKLQVWPRAAHVLHDLLGLSVTRKSSNMGGLNFLLSLPSADPSWRELVCCVSKANAQLKQRSQRASRTCPKTN